MEGLAPRQPTPRSVDVWNETPSAGPIGLIFGAEGLAEQSLLRLDARQHNDER